VIDARIEIGVFSMKLVRRRDCLFGVPAAGLAAALGTPAQAQSRDSGNPPEEIARSLVYRYCRSLDRLDAPLLQSCFHPDAVIDMGTIYRGPAGAFVDVAMQFMGGMSATRHVVGNVLNVGDGFESYVDAWHLVQRDAGWRELNVRGRYLHRVAFRARRWAFIYHGEVVDYGSEQAADRSWFDGRIGLPRGARGSDDASARLMPGAPGR